MLSRRRFLLVSLLALGCNSMLMRRLSSFAGYQPPLENLPNATSIDAALAATLAGNAFTVTEASVAVEEGIQPATIYEALWTRDHAYVLWHYPGLFTATQRRQFVSHRLAARTTGAESDPDGGTLPADWIADRIDGSGTRFYKNAGDSALPFMDGIAFVVLALWADWNETADTTTFEDNQSAIDDCLAALPRSINGCIYSDPLAPSVDYGFTDSVKKTGDVAYGTALLAWSYKMLAEIAGENGSGTYSTLRAEAESGLATLRQPSGWYKASSGNNASKDDVWATALIAAEGLASPVDCYASGETIVAAYLDGSSDVNGYSSTITQFGLVRHLPVGQSWVGTLTPSGTYQNGGYWLTPLWDCLRAVEPVNPGLARAWASEALAQLSAEDAAEGTWLNVPYEWHNHGVGVGAKGYSASAALVHRLV